MSERREPEPRQADLEDVPRLPRGRGLRLSGPQLFRIVATLALLVFVIVAQKPCAGSVSKFVTSFGSDGSAATMPTPGTVDVPAAGSAAAPDSLDRYERLRPGMSEAEIKAVMERARQKAAADAGSATGSGSAAGSGSATGSSGSSEGPLKPRSPRAGR